MKTEEIEKINKADDRNINFELSHIIGLKLLERDSVQCHPVMPETIIYSVGGIIICEDLTEKNNQVFFRHGQNKINCFKISHSGKYLAVGFTTGEENFDKDLIASIILWDYENKKIMYEINEIYKAVTLLEFSQDDKFLSAMGLNSTFYTWEVAKGNKCFSRVYETPINFILWTCMFKSKDTLNNTNSDHYDYTITIGNDQVLYYADFYFELRTMQYNIKFEKFILPSTGLIRSYTCGFFDQKYNCLYLGSKNGELIIFSLENLYFKNSFNVLNNGITSMVFFPETEEIIVSGGDGKVKKILRTNPIEGNHDILKVQHTIICEIALNSPVNSISVTSDQKEVVVSSMNGKIYRVLTSDLNYILHSTSHYSSINSIAFNEVNKISDSCFTVDDNGNMYQIDLNDFNILGFIPVNDDENATNFVTPPATSVCIGDDESIFIGYGNGLLKNYSNDFTEKLFEIQAHKGSINCIYVDGNYILTGGQDGIVRIWTRRNHELVMQIPAHHSNVREVFADINKPNLIYSCGDDRELICYDMKLQKRLNTQRVNNGFITGIAQKIERENEIISVGINCPLCVWDFYQVNPIKEINIGEKMMTVKI
jgi:WD40 repeat protein